MTNPLSEANQNLYSAEPCQCYQTEHDNMTIKATKKAFQKKPTNPKTKRPTAKSQSRRALLYFILIITLSDKLMT
jgi:hypothetical protein